MQTACKLLPTSIHQRSTADLMPELPVLASLAEYLPDLDPTVGGLFGLQHLFGSTATLIHRLAAGRFESDDVFLLGKPYSANPRVVASLERQLGYWVHPDSIDQPEGVDNDSQMDRRIIEVLDRIAARMRHGRLAHDHRFLLIDDGGRAIRLLHEPRYADIRGRFTGVEQTRCGTRNIADLDLAMPVINVAESWVKLDHESPLIATSVVHELARKLDGLTAAGIPVSLEALVIGFGSIGQAVAAELRRTGRQVAVYDTDPGRRALAVRAGYAVFVDLRSALRRGGIVVGCTGLPVLDRSHHRDIADGTLLISASSADTEFRAWQLRSRGRCLGDPNRWTDGRFATTPDSEGRRWDHPCFSLYRITEGASTFYLVNGGFPVNFDGGVDSIPPHEIQLTRSLLFLGAWQASRTRAAGLHDLDDGNQQLLMDFYNACTRMQAA